MHIGVIYPHFEYVTDLAAIRDYAHTAEELGYSHIGADDHMIGANPNRPGGWSGWVNHTMPFFEPFVLFSYMAGLTRKVAFSTCVLLLPQRQTVLVAKQAADLDTLSGGRLRLGLGIGWSEVEYQSLGMNMRDRGKRLDEQVEVLRALWTQELVDFKGKWHTIPNAGLNPLPVQRPIPLWFGGQSEAAIHRAARTGDGWMPLYRSAEDAKPGLAFLDQCLADAGRAREGFGLEARIPYGRGDAGEWLDLLQGWQAVGATHISLLTTHCGFTQPKQHLGAMERFAEIAKDWMG